MEPTTDPTDRVTALGNHLVRVHIWLSDALADLRDDMDAYLDGRADRPRDVLANCLAFCSALGQHHTNEDGGMFPALAEAHPELRPALEQLERDHVFVADILRRLETLVDGLGDSSSGEDAIRVRGELDGLIAILESHFRYEEKVLVGVLNGTE